MVQTMPRNWTTRATQIATTRPRIAASKCICMRVCVCVDGWIPELSTVFDTLLADQASVKPNGEAWTTLVAEYWPWGE